MKKITALFALIALLSVSMRAQTKKESIDDLNETADFYMSAEVEDYARAYETYDKLDKRDPSNPYYKYKKGLCAFHLPDKKQETISLFEAVYKMAPQESGVLLNLGKAYHVNYRFDDAIKYFNQFLATNPPAAEKEQAEKLIKNSEYGKNVTQEMLQADIKNFGPPVNTTDEEYSPVISADETVIIYTYRGPKSTGGLMNGKFKPDAEHGTYYEDVYISRKGKDSAWSEPKGIPNINTNKYEGSLALSPDGQTLYTYRSTEQDSGDIYESRLEGDEWTVPERLKGDVNSNYYEGACSITADGKYLYFTSERKGGFGGRDIYIAEKAEDGTWRNVKNLGDKINTEEDEDSPFIHPDGLTLFFSSKGHNSIGDYDIFYTIKKENAWIEPLNMGYPLNTTDDDRFYVINASGQKGYFSSNRVSNGGNGSQDIFTVTPGILGEKPILAMVLGYVYGNDKPIDAQIEITKKSNGEKIGPFTSNVKTGKYLVALSPGENYTFHVRSKDFGEITEDLDIAKLTKFVELRKDFHMVKDGYIDPHNVKNLNELLAGLDTLTSVPDAFKPAPDTLKTQPFATNNNPAEIAGTSNKKGNTDVTGAAAKYPCDDFKTLDFSALKGKSLNDIHVYKKLLAIAEKICAEKMTFKVQIAAYRHPENYKYDHLKEYGTPEVVDYPDGITRFTQGQYNGIKDAEVQRQKAIHKGQKDAWIVGFIDGKRYTLEELIMVDFYNKNISQFNENLQELKDYISYK
jgi:tetratricopeptide (TPR) repeat protein